MAEKLPIWFQTHTVSSLVGSLELRSSVAVPPICCYRRRSPSSQATSSPGNPACFWSQGGSILTAPTSIPSTTAPWFSALPAFNAVVTHATGRRTCATLQQHHRRLLATTVGSEERRCAWQFDVASNEKTLITCQTNSRSLATVPGTLFFLALLPTDRRSRPRRSGQVLHLT